jgi:GTP-binding protein
MADIPGLIEHASKGAGMGDKFLRHVERTRVLLHLVDPSPHVTPSPLERLELIMDELDSYSSDVSRKPVIFVVTKLDLPENEEPAEALKKSLEEKGRITHLISAATGRGVKDLMRSASKLLAKERRKERAAAEAKPSAQG